jgi:hypothetical protein
MVHPRVTLLLIVAIADGSRAAEGVDAGATLAAVASSEDSVRLVAGAERVAFLVGDSAWVTVDGGSFATDVQLAGSLKSLVAQLPGTAVGYAWGRTPLVFNDDKRLPRFARSGTLKPRAAPGPLVSVVAVSETTEVWQYSQGLTRKLAMVDGGDRIRTIPPLLAGGPAVPAARSGLCAVPTVWRLLPVAEGALALVLDCHRDAPIRAVAIHPDATTRVRRLDPVGPLDVEPDEAAVGVDGAVVLAGRRFGRLVLARSQPDGSWHVTPTSLSTALVLSVVTSGAAVWALVAAEGPNGKGQVVLTRDGVPVVLTLEPHEVAREPTFGLVVRATDPATGRNWLLAERPSGPVRPLP